MYAFFICPMGSIRHSHIILLGLMAVEYIL
jgi:hypothetical protein